MKYLILINHRHDTYNRHWIICDTLERAKKVAYEYDKDNQFHTEIYEMPQKDLRYA